MEEEQGREEYEEGEFIISEQPLLQLGLFESLASFYEDKLDLGINLGEKKERSFYVLLQLLFSENHLKYVYFFSWAHESLTRNYSKGYLNARTYLQSKE